MHILNRHSKYVAQPVLCESVTCVLVAQTRVHVTGVDPGKLLGETRQR